jgi:hypothetical protein
MAAFKNDGSIPYGSKVLTINSVAYVAENFDVTRDAKTIDRENEVGEPSGQIGIATVPTATATLQLATTSTVQPLQGNTCSVTCDSVIGAETWIVWTTSRVFAKDEAQKITVTFRKQIN